MKRILLTSFLALLLFFSSALATSQLTLAWTPSTSPNVISQKLYYSNTPVNPNTGRFNFPVSISLGMVTSRLVGNLADGTYYFAVTATDSNNLESVYSNIVTVVLATPSPTPGPQAPTNLHVGP
jgi:hypothetical protein